MWLTIEFFKFYGVRAINSIITKFYELEYSCNLETPSFALTLVYCKDFDLDIEGSVKNIIFACMLWILVLSIFRFLVTFTYKRKRLLQVNVHSHLKFYSLVFGTCSGSTILYFFWFILGDCRKINDEQQSFHVLCMFISLAFVRV